MTEKTNSNEIPKDPQRLAVLARIDEYERKGWFSKDVEDDPPTIPLEPEKTDYLCRKFSNKILRIAVYAIARHFIHKIIKNKQMIIKEVNGLENFIKVRKSGLIMTCNHFNAFDNFAVYHVIEKVLPHRKMYKVIREGNYTSFPGMYGLFFRHCDTLPLSSKFSTMKLFIKSMDILLRRGEKVLVYASLTGLIRGMIRDGFEVIKGFKIADIDPRKDEIENCYTISDKARCIAGGVLEVISLYLNKKLMNSDL